VARLKGLAEFFLQREDATLDLKAYRPKIHLTSLIKVDFQSSD